MEQHNSIIGLEVFGVDEQDVLGSIAEFRINCSRRAVEFVVVNRVTQSGNEQVSALPLGSLLNIGNNFAVVKSGRDFVQNVAQNKEIVHEGCSLLGSRVCTQDGDLLGVVDGYDFNLRTGEITTLVLDTGARYDIGVVAFLSPKFVFLNVAGGSKLVNDGCVSVFRNGAPQADHLEEIVYPEVQRHQAVEEPAVDPAGMYAPVQVVPVAPVQVQYAQPVQAAPAYQYAQPVQVQYAQPAYATPAAEPVSMPRVSKYANLDNFSASRSQASRNASAAQYQPVPPAMVDFQPAQPLQPAKEATAAIPAVQTEGNTEDEELMEYLVGKMLVEDVRAEDGYYLAAGTVLQSSQVIEAGKHQGMLLLLMMAIED